jgi:hypothetical protein
LIDERLKTLSKSWHTFLKHPKHHCIGMVVEREKTNLPAKFVPWAPGIVIVSDYLLRVAGQAPYSEFWRRHPRHGYYYCKNTNLVVRERSGFWFMESGSDVVVFVYASMPVCTRTHREAINLSAYFNPESYGSYHIDRGHGLRWVGSKPDGILDC